MRLKSFARLSLLALWAAAGPAGGVSDLPAESRPVRYFGVHYLVGSRSDFDVLLGELPDAARIGVNLLILEVDYNFEFVSHPELRGESPVSRADAKKLASACRRLGVRLVPEFQSLGHQSWQGRTGPLLTAYPDLDETPGRHPGNKGIFSRSWCPSNPRVNEIVFDLYDELIDAFEADALHVGMDEVTAIGSAYCPRCRGKHPARLFAKAVNDAYDHVAGKRGKEMFMWADRLIDAAAIDYGEFEAAKNGTHRAVDRIPKGIVLCDWHYKKRKTYPSLPMFLAKGFRVLPASWNDPAAVRSLVEYSLETNSPAMLGHLCTLWLERAPGFSRAPQVKAAAALLTTKD
ncbi:MAG: family 20 glycosylhydrolase [Spirochaetales bacterium]|nr:family 20 glycosylhydrolase [Spirochaetales bacterium]